MIYHKKRSSSGITSRVYRRIYEKHYGPIPKDELGRSYDIHHIDGNYLNNDPANLIALSINDHYDVHYKQGDYGACVAIARTMNLTADQISELQTKQNLKRIKNGTHNFVTDTDIHRRGGKAIAKKRVEEGNHPFLGGKIQRLTQKKLVESNSHIFQGSHMNDLMKKLNTHPMNQKWVCENCGISGLGLPNYTRWHGENCGKSNANFANKINQSVIDGTHITQIKWICENCNKSGRGLANYARWHGNNCKHKEQK